MLAPVMRLKLASSVAYCKDHNFTFLEPHWEEGCERIINASVQFIEDEIFCKEYHDL